VRCCKGITYEYVSLGITHGLGDPHVFFGWLLTRVRKDTRGSLGHVECVLSMSLCSGLGVQAKSLCWLNDHDGIAGLVNAVDGGLYFVGSVRLENAVGSLGWILLMVVVDGIAAV
jgi:hypothetical protein